jgi:hypothetical protein
MDSNKANQLKDKRLASLQRQRNASKRQTATPTDLMCAKSRVVKRAKFSYGKQVNFSGSKEGEKEEEEQAVLEEEDTDWLRQTERNTQQDIETSKKELELSKTILEEIEQKMQAEKKPSHRLRDQKVLIGACKEYSDSRIQILKERSRQVQFWLGSREMGRKVPGKAPAEWLAVDLEWRHWLGEQAAARRDGFDESPIEELDDAAWRILGPLPHILAAYMCLGEE